MAIATPVLERKLNITSNVAVNNDYGYRSVTDEQHNARIKDNYARLINPDVALSDLIASVEMPAPKKVEPVIAATPVQERPYLVTNARADSALFRADSYVNQKVETAQTATNEEEENEDLRPTLTTQRYRTIERKTENQATVNKSTVNIGKREKIIISAFVSIVIALFALVIINSAIISGLQNQVNQTKMEYQNTYAQSQTLNAEVEAAKAEADENAKIWAAEQNN